MRSTILFTLALAVTAAGLPMGAATAEAADAPPDIVRLESGAMMRGTIVEMDPEGEVVIQLATGETRRFSMSEVAYAGPAAEEKSGSREALVELDMRANEPNISFQRYAGSTQARATAFGGEGGFVGAQGTADTYTTICTAPCARTLPKGTLRLALQKKGRRPAEADAVMAQGPGTLVGTYKDNRGIRTAGWILGIGGSLAATGVVIGEVAGNTGAFETPSTGVLVGAAVGGLVSGIAGFIMTTVNDRARIEYQAERVVADNTR